MRKKGILMLAVSCFVLGGVLNGAAHKIDYSRTFYFDMGKSELSINQSQLLDSIVQGLDENLIYEFIYKTVLCLFQHIFGRDYSENTLEQE